MLFNSYEFIFIYLPLILIAWWNLARWTELRLAVLVAASYLFYGWWKWEFTALLAFSTLVDYLVGIAIHRASTRQRRISWLMVSVLVNLTLLGYFKYSGFLAESINGILDALRYGGAIPVPHILLPVGISFYTFQSLSYSIDIYRGEVQPARSLVHFAACVSMFPQLIAGPIVRYSDLEDQINNIPVEAKWEQLARGVFFFVMGMSQKILLADMIAQEINPLLEKCSELQLVAGWFCLLGYTLQLYFDFAGYSNMAIGLGLMLGLQFPQNFDSPYQATNIQDFWRRWHMTLSKFLRDYLYIPLGGNRYGAIISRRNLLIVMVIGGVWHGAGWTFVLWGLFHGALLVAYSVYRSNVTYRLPSPVGCCITFLCVMLGWLLFRSTDMTMAGHWMSALLGLHGLDVYSLSSIGASKGGGACLIGLLLCWFAPNLWNCKPNFNWMTAVSMAVLLIVCVLRFDIESPFLYFQF